MIKKGYLCLITVIMFICCSCDISREYPTEGVWYCEELKMEIDFSCSGNKSGVEVYSGEEYSLFDFWTRGAGIYIRPAGTVDVYLRGTYRYKNDVFYITTEDDTTYSFLRIDEINTDDSE